MDVDFLLSHGGQRLIGKEVFSVSLTKSIRRKEAIGGKQMKERIILAPGANGRELMASLARRGVNCFNLRICSAGELARMALMRSGISVTESILDSREENAIIAEAVEGVAYFGKASYADIKEICHAIRRMRSLVTSAEEEKVLSNALSRGEFQEKNKALLQVYRNYMKIMSRKKVIDATALVRKAATTCRPMDAEFIVLKEYPLNPLQGALMDRLSDKSVKEMDLRQMFGLTHQPVHIESFKNCYGAPNEVESILADIYRDKENRLDDCMVVVTDAGTYGQLFFDNALLYELPITFGCGIPIINSNPAKLLKLYHHWSTDGFFSAGALSAMLESPAFNRSKLESLIISNDIPNCKKRTFYSVLKGLRLTNDATLNEKRLNDFKKAVKEEMALMESVRTKDYDAVCGKQTYIPYLEAISKELELPAEDFIAKYARIRTGENTPAERLLMILDRSATRAIYEELKVLRSLGTEYISEGMLNVLSINVCRQGSEPGKLHITGVEDALAVAGRSLYVAGLSASNFPGSPKENHLLLDADLELFGDRASDLTSAGRIARKREQLLHLVHLAADFEAKIFVSYAGHNVSELKKENASSLIFELYSEADGRPAASQELEEHIINVRYFDPAISGTRLIGDAYVDGCSIVPRTAEREKNTMPVPWNLEKEYSPTALQNFFQCPRKFMLRSILEIPEPVEDNTLEIISSQDEGSLAHALMERLGNVPMTEEDFIKLSGEYFDHFLAEHPPLIPEHTEPKKQQFLEMMATAYEMESHREILQQETEIRGVHESGVKLHGFPDRVEKLEDGSFRIIDFKAGKSVKHTTDDIDTCLQAMIYAYLMEQDGYVISDGEYKYIRYNESITCKYDAEMKDGLSNKLNDFKHAILEGKFPIADNSEAGGDSCKYCKYEEICGKMEKEGDASLNEQR